MCEGTGTEGILNQGERRRYLYSVPIHPCEATRRKGRDPQKSLLSHFFVTLIVLGFGVFCGARRVTSQADGVQRVLQGSLSRHGLLDTPPESIPLNQCPVEGVLPTHQRCSQYPLARNQYINNSPGIFSCIRTGVNTCAACICTENNSPKIFLCIGTRDVQIHALYQYRGQGPKCEYIFQK